MRILDRYILGSMLKVFLGCIFVFLMLYVVIDLFSHLDEILKQKTGLDLLFAYYLNFLPLIFVQVAPFASLLGCLYTLGMLNRNNEIIAMRASGLSILQISKTLIIFACLVSILVFLVNDKFVPRAEITKETLKSQMEKGTKKAKARKEETITNLSVYGLRNRLFFINKFIVSKNKMEGITILEQDNLANLRKKIIASYGIYKDGAWNFHECVTYFFDSQSRLKGEPVYVPVQLMDITESPTDFLKQRQKPQFMSVAQLNDYILKLSMGRAEAVVKSLKVDFYYRFLMPLTTLVILFVGIPFSLMMHRRATGLSSLGIAIMVGFLYYVVNAVSIAFGKAGLFPPLLSVLLSPLIFLMCSFILIREFS
ncbi:LptF/LptG family permease [Candidatus Omnitrophota bacterium]